MPTSFAKVRSRSTPRSPRRASASARGYGGDWRALRERAMRSGACGPSVCTEPGCGRTDRLNLDHIVPRSRGGSDDFANLQWKCPSHHSAKTAGQDGGFGHPLKFHPPLVRGPGPEVCGVYQSRRNP